MSNYTLLDHLDLRSKEYLAVQWIYTNRCNFSCHYCDPEVHNSSTPELALSTVLPFCGRLIKYAESIGKKVYLELTGGEVTFLPDFGEIIQSVRDAGGHLGINSNGTPGLSWWKIYAPQLDSLMLSYHHGFSELKHFEELVPYLSTLPQLKLHLSIMMEPEHFSSCLEVAEKLKKLTSGSLTLQRLVPELSGQNLNFSYTDQQLSQMTSFNKSFGSKQWLQKFKDKIGPKKPMPRGGLILSHKNGKNSKITSSDLINRDLNHFKGWTCQAGVENLVIDRFGKIYRGWCLEGGLLGDINDPDFNFGLSPITCQKDSCCCGFDLLSKKVSP